MRTDDNTGLVRHADCQDAADAGPDSSLPRLRGAHLDIVAISRRHVRSCRDDAVHFPDYGLSFTAVEVRATERIEFDQSKAVRCVTDVENEQRIGACELAQDSRRVLPRLMVRVQGRAGGPAIGRVGTARDNPTAGRYETPFRVDVDRWSHHHRKVYVLVVEAMVQGGEGDLVPSEYSSAKWFECTVRTNENTFPEVCGCAVGRKLTNRRGHVTARHQELGHLRPPGGAGELVCGAEGSGLPRQLSRYSISVRQRAVEHDSTFQPRPPAIQPPVVTPVDYLSTRRDDRLRQRVILVRENVSL